MYGFMGKTVTTRAPETVRVLATASTWMKTIGHMISLNQLISQKLYGALFMGLTTNQGLVATRIAKTAVSKSGEQNNK